ncbi:hypothetical protein RF11_06743 [Thelohanellus kitauei]|uniref:Uncharacterized protein n=1 Tax=Thelohanellus kitauei TaxID=669202 RepID=A0A0C2MM57_THEKT|nr:hypothetical protein RF11_06743 [Thelohanellus kitauei]
MVILCFILFVEIFLKVQAVKTKTQEIKEAAYKKALEELFTITIGETRYRPWEPVQEWDSEVTSPEILKDHLNHPRQVNYTMKRISYEIQDDDIFKILEIESPDHKLYYLRICVKAGSGSKYKDDQFIGILMKKPFENPN